MITSLYAGLLGIFFVFLSFRVANLRKKLKVGLGDGGEKKLTKAIRAHGNFSEYALFIIVLMYFAEMQSIILFGTSTPIIIHIMGMILLFARGYHAYGITQHSGLSTGRMVGILLTWGLIVFLSLINIVSFWFLKDAGL